MRKLYYLSKSKQKLKEFEYLAPKSILMYCLVVCILLGFLWGARTLISSFTSTTTSISELKSENKILREKISKLNSIYKNFDQDLNDLKSENNYLRLAANLPTLSKDETTLGFGGSEFESKNDLKFSSFSNLDELDKLVESLSSQIKFEKSEYQKISSKLKENEVLYESIPAIKPCKGILASNGFGMREHPILGINKMHEGIDIITDVGTKVMCTGNGIVSFVGIKGGYGLTLEVDHSSGYKTVYGHLSGAYVTEGQKVTRGKVIALTGNSGLSTGPHLHYEVHHEGVKLDPAQFFFDDLALFEPKKKNNSYGDFNK